MIKKGFLQALGVAAYCSLIGLIFWKANTLFGKAPNYLGPVLFLTLFSVSALICGTLVFYQPYLLFVAQKQKQAAELVLTTTAWLFAFLSLLLILVMVF